MLFKWRMCLVLQSETSKAERRRTVMADCFLHGDPRNAPPTLAACGREILAICNWMFWAKA